MPTDVIPPPSWERFGAEPNPCELEAKAGSLQLVAPGGLQQVRVVVYRTSLEHFAVVHPRRRVGKPLAVVNLRNTAPDRCGNGFVVRQKGFDNTGSVRFVCGEREVDSWMAAFSSPAATGAHHALPVLVEADEC